MSCDDRWSELLSASNDGEATPLEAAAARRHAAACVSCAATLRDLADLSRRFASARDRAVPQRVRLRALAVAGRRSRRRAAIAAAACVAAVAVGLVAWPSRHLGTALADDLEAHHLRAFSRASPCELESSDPAVVRRWLAGAVGYPVEVPAIPGARLLGARRCRLHGVLTASLLYRRGDEALTVFIPHAGTDAERDAARVERSPGQCTQARLGDHVCAAAGRLAVAESASTARSALRAP